MTQLVKQSNSIGNLIPKLPKKTVTIYDAYKTSVRIMDFNTNAQMNKLVEVIGQWSFYLGLSDKVSEKELILIAQFIKENFGSLNITDMQEAIKMCTNGELDSEIEHFGKLSPLYIGKVLNAYKLKRSSLIVDINKKVAQLEFEANKKVPTAEENLNNMKIIVQNAWLDVNSGKTFYDFGDCVYNYIKEKKLMVVDDDMIERAKKYAKRNIKEEQHQSTMKSVINNMRFEKVDAESIKRKKAREYIVNEWLSSMNKKQAVDFVKQMKL